MQLNKVKILVWMLVLTCGMVLWVSPIHVTPISNNQRSVKVAGSGTYTYHSNPGDPFQMVVGTIYSTALLSFNYGDLVYYHQITLDAGTLYLLFFGSSIAGNWGFRVIKADGAFPVFQNTGPLSDNAERQEIVFNVSTPGVYNLTISMLGSGSGSNPFCGIGFLELPQITLNVDPANPGWSTGSCSIRAGYIDLAAKTYTYSGSSVKYISTTGIIVRGYVPFNVSAPDSGKLFTPSAGRYIVWIYQSLMGTFREKATESDGGGIPGASVIALGAAAALGIGLTIRKKRSKW